MTVELREFRGERSLQRHRRLNISLTCIMFLVYKLLANIRFDHIDAKAVGDVGKR